MRGEGRHAGDLKLQVLLGKLRLPAAVHQHVGPAEQAKSARAFRGVPQVGFKVGTLELAVEGRDVGARHGVVLAGDWEGDAGATDRAQRGPVAVGQDNVEGKGWIVEDDFLHARTAKCERNALRSIGSAVECIDAFELDPLLDAERFGKQADGGVVNADLRMAGVHQDEAEAEDGEE